MVLLFTRKFNWVCIPQPPPSTPPWLSSTPPSCPRVSRVYLGSTEGRERNPGRAWKRFLLFFSSLPVLLLSGRRLFEKKWACQRRSEHSDLARNALLYWIFPHLFCTFLGVGGVCWMHVPVRFRREKRVRLVIRSEDIRKGKGGNPCASKRKRESACVHS